MYDWQEITSLNQKFEPGMVVTLNEDWSGYSFLKKEFGELFPRKINRVDKDVVDFKVGKDKTISFASQTLSRKNRN